MNAQTRDLIYHFLKTTPVGMTQLLSRNLERCQDDTLDRVLFFALKDMSHPVRETARLLIHNWFTEEQQGVRALAFALEMGLHVIRQENQRTCEPVWTGPSSSGNQLRNTRQALLQIIQSAQTTLWIVSYAIYDIPEITEALKIALDTGVEINMLIDTPDENHSFAYNNLFAIPTQLKANVRIYIWPQEIRPKINADQTAKLHVKCAIADSTHMLISSANLTSHAMDYNMELGVLIENDPMIGTVKRHFDELVEDKVIQVI